MELKSLTKYFGGLAAVLELDLMVNEGEILGLIGPNGAGKTTALNIIGGLYPPTRGRIIFGGEDLTRLPAHQRAGRGIARVFQDNVLFSGFSVLENVLAGFHLQTDMGLGQILFGGPKARRHDEELLSKSLDILEFFDLKSDKDRSAASLPHGKQRVLSLAIALATKPRLLLLDEPVTGMNAVEVANMIALIRELRDEKGLTCVVVEHNLRVVMGLCERISVLNFGRKIAEGPPEEIVRNQEVIEAYIGAEEEADWTGQLNL